MAPDTSLTIDVVVPARLRNLSPRRCRPAVRKLPSCPHPRGVDPFRFFLAELGNRRWLAPIDALLHAPGCANPFSRGACRLLYPPARGNGLCAPLPPRQRPRAPAVESTCPFLRST